MKTRVDSWCVTDGVRKEKERLTAASYFTCYLMAVNQDSFSLIHLQEDTVDDSKALTDVSSACIMLFI